MEDHKGGLPTAYNFFKGNGASPHVISEGKELSYVHLFSNAFPVDCIV